MSRRIKATREDAQKIIAAFTDWLMSAKSNTGKMSFEVTQTVNQERAKLSFTETAMLKMQYLVHSFDSEVAWHGVCKRVADDKSEFVVTDILVYPQNVTGSTVNTDQASYQNWLTALDDDTFNDLRFQGHSHVNMGTTPSATDIEHQNGILEMCDDSMFYVFVIANKKGDINTMIYDLKRNTYFEKKDVDIEIVSDASGCGKVIRDAATLVKKTTYSYANTYAGYGGASCGYVSTAKQQTALASASTIPASGGKVGGSKKSDKPTKLSRIDDPWDPEWDEYLC